MHPHGVAGTPGNPGPAKGGLRELNETSPPRDPGLPVTKRNQRQAQAGEDAPSPSEHRHAAGDAGTDRGDRT